jgi:S1-C subfamily serine protease
VLLAARPDEDALARGTGPGDGEGSAKPEVQLDGLTVGWVNPAGAYAGLLREGDRIVSVDGKAAKTDEAVRKELARPGPHRVVVVRDGAELLVLVPGK